MCTNSRNKSHARNAVPGLMEPAVTVMVVSTLPLAQAEMSLIVSITSTNLRMIAFPARYGFERKKDLVFTMHCETIDDCVILSNGCGDQGINVGWTWCFVSGTPQMTREWISRNSYRGRVKPAEKPGRGWFVVPINEFRSCCLAVRESSGK